MRHWVSISWFIAAAIGKCDGDKQEVISYVMIHLIDVIFHFLPAKIRKRHETTLGKARKVAAEGKSMKLVSDFCYC
jgi:hypothetical protein